MSEWCHIVVTQCVTHTNEALRRMNESCHTYQEATTHMDYHTYKKEITHMNKCFTHTNKQVLQS